MLNREIKLSIISPFLLLSTLLFSHLQISCYAQTKSYIVYLGQHGTNAGRGGGEGGGFSTMSDEDEDAAITRSHYALLGSVSHTLSVDDEKPSMLYSYTKSINGFAATLNEEQAEQLRKNPEVRGVLPNRKYDLHTTHSWEFLGLERSGTPVPRSLWNQAKFGEDVIIANLDTGVWPESASFKDDGMGRVPARWKGSCQPDGGVACNNKLIGAKFFSKGVEAAVGPMDKALLTARDEEGHGSHTLATAAGSAVTNASIFGYGSGTAKGGSPKARVAAYKVCWKDGCFAADILAGFDAALSDGVDVISFSVGGEQADLFSDAAAIGSFHAMLKGVPVIASAGNSGPAPETLSNVAPWLFTIGASTMDRDFVSTVILGDKKEIRGTSLSDKALPAGKFLPLIAAVDAKLDNATASDAQICLPGSLDPTKVVGKIVVCTRGRTNRVQKGKLVGSLGAVGMILANDQTTGFDILADPHFLPASHISYLDGQTVFNYIKSSKEPTASISPVNAVTGIKPAPIMASFSSRGPSTISPGLLKPDVTGPGVNVLAAFSQAVSPSEDANDTRRIAFNVMSGTSMSCPHVSGIVGLVKSIHPDWSPAAIKSAIMTTATSVANDGKTIQDETGSTATPFAYGAGHVQPNLAADPGLVYDLTTNDYLNALCAFGYNETVVKGFALSNYTCPQNFSLLDFNYPSIAVHNLDGSAVATRKLKNVGVPGTYVSKVQAPAEVSVTVEPAQLAFTKIGEEKEYKITFKAAMDGAPKNYVFGQLLWSDGKHEVISPFVVKAT